MCIQWLGHVLFILTGSLLITENLACNVVYTRDQLITLRLSIVAGEKLTIPVEIVGCSATVKGRMKKKEI